jgi:hypothetical protein
MSWNNVKISYLFSTEKINDFACLGNNILLCQFFLDTVNAPHGILRTYIFLHYVETRNII